MRREALEFIACPKCHGALTLTRGEAESDGHIIEGEVGCAKGCRYPISAGVPTLLAGDVDEVKLKTAQRFAEEWTRWSESRSYYEKQFLGWLAPLTAQDFEGKAVFEGGCGKGRHTELVSKFGARAIVSIDLGDSAYVAFKQTRALKNAHVVIGDLLNPPVQRVFDLAFSVGVLHHLPDPAAGFKALKGVVKKGGRVAFWVYGRENNEWIVKFVDPIRKTLTSKMPAEWLKPLSMPPSAALWAAIKLLYKPKQDGRGPSLPYGDYFAAMHDFPLDEIHSIVFDQLVTPVAYYLSESEVREWFDGGFDDVKVRWHGEYSWTGHARVTSTTAPQP